MRDGSVAEATSAFRVSSTFPGTAIRLSARKRPRVPAKSPDSSSERVDNICRIFLSATGKTACNSRNATFASNRRFTLASGANASAEASARRSTCNDDCPVVKLKSDRATCVLSIEKAPLKSATCNPLRSTAEKRPIPIRTAAPRL